MKIYKTKDVKTPARGTGRSAGIDFYIPEGFGSYIVPPGGDVLIASGIKARVPEGYALIAMNKSGIALKGLQVGACVVDEDYQGEIHLHVRNISRGLITIQEGEKLVQMLLVPVFYDSVELVGSEQELFPETTERGEGGFGSTGQ